MVFAAFFMHIPGIFKYGDTAWFAVNWFLTGLPTGMDSEPAN